MRNAFLGSNTPNGFTSYFDNIIKMGGGRRLFILKGGSGTGKSTLMKKVAEFAAAEGLEAEAYHCSSDIASLDGVLVPQLGMAVVDGTSPHVVDVTAYGAFEEVVNLGDCVNRDMVKDSAGQIADLIAHKKSCYATAYAYLAAAGRLYADAAAKYAGATDPVKVAGVAGKIVAGMKLKDKKAGGYGKRRRLFAAALTPSGYVDYTGELMDAMDIYELERGFDTVSAEVLERVADAVNLAGYDLEFFCSPMDAARPLALYCGELDCSIVSRSFLSGLKLCGNVRIDMDDCVDFRALERDAVKQDMNEAMILLTFGYERMGKAASFHQELERIYRPAVDFTGINAKLAYVLGEMRRG